MKLYVLGHGVRKEKYKLAFDIVLSWARSSAVPVESVTIRARVRRSPRTVGMPSFSAQVVLFRTTAPPAVQLPSDRPVMREHVRASAARSILEEEEDERVSNSAAHGRHPMHNVIAVHRRLTFATLDELVLAVDYGM